MDCSWKFEKVVNWQFLGKMASLWPYFLAKIGCFEALFGLWWKVEKVENRRFLEKWQAYSLTFWPKLGILRHFWICGGSLRKLKIGDFWKNGKPIALLFGQNWAF